MYYVTVVLIYTITSQLTPAVGFIVVVVMMFVIPDVPRGAADGDSNIVVNQSEIRSSGFKGYMEDLAYIAKKFVIFISLKQSITSNFILSI